MPQNLKSALKEVDILYILMETATETIAETTFDGGMIGDNGTTGYECVKIVVFDVVRALITLNFNSSYRMGGIRFK